MECIDKFQLLGSIEILWFGRLVPTRVIGTTKVDQGEYGTVTLFTENIKASLPLDQKGGLFFINFMLKRAHEFINTMLLKIGTTNYYKFYFDRETFIAENKENKSVIDKQFSEFTPQTIPHGLKFAVTSSNVISLISKIKAFSQINLQSESILAEAGVESQFFN